jgi:hypothetical protein
MNKINTLYTGDENKILIYGTSIFDHKIIYISLVNGMQYSMILKIDDMYYYDFFEKIKFMKGNESKIRSIILKKFDTSILNISKREEYLKDHK